MEWSEENTLLFIDEYKNRPILWDLSHPLHYNKIKRRDAWNEISGVIGRPATELKKKWDNLMASFRRERTKVIKVEPGKDADGGHYTGSWYAFEALRFTMEKNKHKSVLDTAQRIGNMVEVLVAEETVDSLEQDASQQTPHSGPLSPALAPSTSRPPSATPCPLFEFESYLTSAVPQSQSQLQQTIQQRKTPPELQQTENQTLQALHMLNNIVSNKRVHEPDECDLFGQMIAKKLRKLAADERDLLMYDIHGMFIPRHLRSTPPETISSAVNSHPSSSGSSSTHVPGHEPPHTV